MSRQNINILITAGPTREPIDAVRHISNFATGSLGVEIAREAKRKGYNVKLLYGYGAVPVPEGIPTIRFTSTQDLLNKVLREIKDADVYISSAAISDYAPIYEDKKIDSGKDNFIIKLKPTPKVLKEAKKVSKKVSKKSCIFVAFKLEYKFTEQELIDDAIRNYGDIADILIVNDLTKINKTKHESIILYKGKIINRSNSKIDLAKNLINVLGTLFKSNK